MSFFIPCQLFTLNIFYSSKRQKDKMSTHLMMTIHRSQATLILNNDMYIS